jgi:hypothetical protein
LLELERDAIEASWLLNVGAQADNGLMNVQQFLFIKKFSFFNLVLGRFMIGKEILLVDRGQIRVIEVVRDLLFLLEVVVVVVLHCMLWLLFLFHDWCIVFWIVYKYGVCRS